LIEIVGALDLSPFGGGRGRTGAILNFELKNNDKWLILNF
jgi:hypothetical protein